jgi:hypothetical protein
MSQLFTNNASGTNSAQVEIGHGSVTLQTGEASLFPEPTGADFFQLTMENTAGDLEICTCTDNNTGTDVLTITRAQENTAEQVFAVGSRVECRMTAATHDSFLQVYSGQMQGELDMNNNVLRDPLLTDGEIRNSPLRGTDGGTGNEILVPTAGDPPTLGGDVILTVGNAVGNYVIESRQVIGGEGLAAMGDLSVDRTVDLDFTELTTMLGAATLADDLFVVYDDADTEHKAIPYRDAGIPMIIDNTANPTPTADETNAMWLCTHSAATIAFEIGTGIGVIGNVLLVQMSDTTRKVTISGTGGVVINSAHAGPTTVEQWSVLIAVCTNTDVWTVYGDGE